MQVVLSVEQVVCGVILELVLVDEVDVIWVNGVVVGSQYGVGERCYLLLCGLLKVGFNVIVVNVLDIYGEGGLVGFVKVYGLQFDDGEWVVLQGLWKYWVVLGQQVLLFVFWQVVIGLLMLYNGMIVLFGGFGLCGMLWYQGELNIGDGVVYVVWLCVLCDDWWCQFGVCMLLLFVQLVSYGQLLVVLVDSGWVQVCEVQWCVVVEDVWSGFVIVIDIGDVYDIYLLNKQEFGCCLVCVVCYVVYGEQDLVLLGSWVVMVVWMFVGVVIVFEDVEGVFIVIGVL